MALQQATISARGRGSKEENGKCVQYTFQEGRGLSLGLSYHRQAQQRVSCQKAKYTQQV